VYKFNFFLNYIRIKHILLGGVDRHLLPTIGGYLLPTYTTLQTSESLDYTVRGSLKSGMCLNVPITG